MTLGPCYPRSGSGSLVRPQLGQRLSSTRVLFPHTRKLHGDRILGLLALSFALDALDLLPPGPVLGAARRLLDRRLYHAVRRPIVDSRFITHVSAPSRSSDHDLLLRAPLAGA